MIKEYFTDGLIGLAIILSLFRTDLVGINNIINYPEVQDIILGQTVAYSPASYSHIINSHSHLGSSKHLDFSNDAFTAWYQNINNSPFFRERHHNDIEAFLVSGSQQNIVLEHVVETTQNLPEESANSYEEVAVSNPSVPGTSAETFQTSLVDDSVVFNNPFPGCNLTKEDLDLIDVLWQQDVDLGVGKEVFDTTLRLEIESKKEQELLKHQQWEKAQLQLKEKHERERQELAERWLKENFRRDGETGEWIRNSGGVPGSTIDPETDDSLTLEAALDFLSANIDHSLMQNFDVSPDVVPNLPCEQLTDTCFINPQESQTQNFSQPQELLSHQDSLEESWNGLLDYLNNPPEENNSSPMSQFSLNVDNLVPDIKLDQGLETQNDYLIQNVSMQSQEPQSVSSVVDSSYPFLLNNGNDQMNFDLDSINFLNNLASMQSADLDLVDDNDLFGNLAGGDGESLMDTNITLNDNMDTFSVLEDNLSQPARSVGSILPYDDLSESLDGLEGAIGGSDLNDAQEDVTRHYSKISRLSESSNDSGYAYQGGFSSSSSASSSAGSPAGCHNGNTSTAGNDTELDPHGTQTVVRHAVAHNHTYNTPPGQIPREVKKYAHKEPSRKGPQSRDQRRAEEFKVPFTIDEIIESPVETFNELLTNHKLTESQLSLIRDIRRRGKNKIAAQNCRKRKVNVIVNLSDEMVDLQKARDQLLAERADMEKETRKMKEKFGNLYTQIFQSLRDERGRPYDPNLYSLQQTSDGNVFIVPRNVSQGNKYSTPSSASSSPSSSKDSVNSKKRKSFDE